MQSEQPAGADSPAPGPEVALRPLHPGDLPWVLACALATGWEQMAPGERQGVPVEAVARQVRAMVLDGLSRPGGGGLVAEVWTGPGALGPGTIAPAHPLTPVPPGLPAAAGTPVGYILYTVLPDDLTGLPVGFFLDIWVHPAWRRHGIARRLCHGAEAQLRAMGLRQVKRSISAHNQASLTLSLQDGARVERLLLTKPL